MEDRYLYRSKRIDNGEWVEGSYVYTFAPDKECPVIGVHKENHWIVEKNGNIVIVDPSTICKCTGFKDKNGELIWENDILMCHGNKKDLCKVCFGEFKVLDIENMIDVDIVKGWYQKPIETDVLSKCEPFCHEMPLTNYYLERMEAEVVSNIFDNPELLEVVE